MVVKKFIENSTDLDKLQEYLKKYSTTYYYIYSLPKYYTQNNKFGVQNKESFTLYFKYWNNSKKIKPIPAYVGKRTTKLQSTGKQI